MYDEIVPIEFQNELIAIRDNIVKESWRVGDIVLSIRYDRPELESGIVHQAVGVFVGKAARTVREYAAISTFFPMEIREKYDVLAFDHFRSAMKFGDRWKDALEYAVNTVDTLNRPATVDMMEQVFAGGETRENYEQAENQGDDDPAKILKIAMRLKDLAQKHPEIWSGVILDDIENLIADIEAWIASQNSPEVQGEVQSMRA